MSQRRLETVDLTMEPINWRRTPTGVTIYDEDNPDAWVQLTFEAGVAPDHRLFMICNECGAILPQRSKPGSGTICGDCGASFDHGDA